MGRMGLRKKVKNLKRMEFEILMKGGKVSSLKRHVGLPRVIKGLQMKTSLTNLSA